MKRDFKILLILFCIVSAFSCRKAPVCDCFEAAGAPAEDNRTSVLPYFEQVNVQDDINVSISIGNTEQVLIQGGSNLIHNVSATVSNKVLTLKNNNICNWLRSYKKSIITVYITMPRVTYITNAGVGNINSLDSITTDSFQVSTTSAGEINLAVRALQIQAHIFGTGDITLSGKCSQFACSHLSGTGFSYCNNLITGYSFISNSGTGDCHVNVTGELDAEIYGSGNIYYSGSPIIKSTITGSGQVIKE